MQVSISCVNSMLIGIGSGPGTNLGPGEGIRPRVAYLASFLRQTGSGAGSVTGRQMTGKQQKRGILSKVIIAFQIG